MDINNDVEKGGSMLADNPLSYRSYHLPDDMASILKKLFIPISIASAFYKLIRNIYNIDLINNK